MQPYTHNSLVCQCLSLPGTFQCPCVVKVGQVGYHPYTTKSTGGGMAVSHTDQKKGLMVFMVTGGLELQLSRNRVT